ncbi:MAG: hypothetical protein CVT83_02850 [Alphaproteobacteria bacterium HGW-Alphaproteobacteria-5]|nr:MAG: hypothetical protein CVT83_02850 [Alphaproteobacteria bacterium HGW-Alphaproteobacteria-5]
MTDNRDPAGDLPVESHNRVEIASICKVFRDFDIGRGGSRRAVRDSGWRDRRLVPAPAKAEETGRVPWGKGKPVLPEQA